MVVHGPDAFDRGDVARLLRQLVPRNIVVAGVMARTAAEESGLDLVYDSRPTSLVISGTEGPVFLANRGKIPESGRVFGSIVASRLPGQGLVHVEFSSGTVYRWNEGDQLLARELALTLGYCLVDATSMDEPSGDQRLVRGCIPGEPVFVNGTVIGRATAATVILRSNNGQVEVVSGLDVKAHGIEKLGYRKTGMISTAWCKSGPVRTRDAKVVSRKACPGRIVVIDHCGHEIYRKMGQDSCGVLAIGDDTTSVCGHICSHLGIPVLGITDNDRDAILPSSFATGSVVIDTRPGRDDDVGAEIVRMVPEGPVLWRDWIDTVLAGLDGRAAIVLDRRGNVP
jgi:hypothetical protein